MTNKKTKIDFIFSPEEDCYSIYVEEETTNNSIWDFMGYVVLNVNEYVFQPYNETIDYSEFTLRKIANFISKLNKQLKQKTEEK